MCITLTGTYADETGQLATADLVQALKRNKLLKTINVDFEVNPTKEMAGLKYEL